MHFHPLTVISIDRPTTDSAAVTLRVPPDLRSSFRHLPGQHLTFRLPVPKGDGGDGADGGELRRTYSVCSPVTDPEGPHTLTVGVRHIPGGVFSTHVVKELTAGDVLESLVPTGRFVLRPRPGQHVAVTGGSGITPVLSMAATVLAAESSARFTLLRAERSAASAMFLEEAADLKDRYPDRFQLMYAFSREEQQSGLDAGRLDVERLRSLLPTLLGGSGWGTVAAPAEGSPTERNRRRPSHPVGGGGGGPEGVAGWYLCGPAGLVGAARTALRELGIDRARIHTELFHAADDSAPGTSWSEADGTAAGGTATDGAVPAATADGATLTATLDGRSGNWPVRGGATLLETVLRHRGDAPYACKGGVCGTCRARLVSGEVRMDRNFALEPEEVAGGYVLACQAHPLTSEVEVDFDG